MLKQKIILITIFLLASLMCWGQKYRLYQTQNIHNYLRLNTITGEVAQIQDDAQMWILVNDIEPNGEYTNRFRLYETQNIWTFIELDTFTGRLWQVQYSVKGSEYRFAIPINKAPLSYSKNRSIYTIYPLTSMYQYYLINEDTGEMWKFQWSTKDDDKYRWIERFR